MLDLVLWSCSVALTPWALGLARKLISGVGGLVSPAAPNGSVALARGTACPGSLLRGPSRHGFGRKFSYEPMMM
jgi:hypothetical protein